MRKKKIAVLMGGPSLEHEVSVRSGVNVVKNLSANRYRAFPIYIDKRRIWLFDGKDEHPLNEPEAMLLLKRKNIDAVFIALHGEYGEDGGVQNLLAAAEIPFTGSKSLESALSMHKMLAGKRLSFADLRVPESEEILKSEWRKKPQVVLKKIYNRFGRNVVIKPINRGSSYGVSIVSIAKGNLMPLEAAIDSAFSASRHVMAEQLIKGREVTCGVIDLNGSIEALLPTEIIPVGRTFFDYDAKYNGASKEITPPINMTLSMIKKIESNAIIAHRALGLKGVTRTDMILTPSGELYVLEVNTIPGLTDASLIPQQAKACGISFPKLLDLMIKDAIYS